MVWSKSWPRAHAPDAGDGSGADSDDRLREAEQAWADAEVARLLGISRAHSCLLRIVNDRQDGCPQDVLLRPEKVLGDQARLVLAFWWRLDAMTAEQWEAVDAAAKTIEPDATWSAVWARSAAGPPAALAAGIAAKHGTWGVARAVAGDAATRATHEIQGAAVMREREQPFVFLPLFGINDPQELAE